MKKWMFLTWALVALPVAMMAQDDDMYFASSKSKTTSQRSSYSTHDTYYSGSSRSVDEYNRRFRSSYEVLPTDTGDIISFAPVQGVYPDSVGDFKVTRQMQRWDDYTPSQAYWEGYNQGQHDSYYWHSPWYYSSYYPWYDSWYYDPWYYRSWHYGWYDPWYYDYAWSWHYPYYRHYGWYGGWTYSYYRPVRYYHGGHARSTGSIDRYGRTHGSFNGYRGSTTGGSRGVSVRSNTRNVGTVNTNRNTVRSVSSGSGNFSGSRSSNTYSGNTGGFSGSRSTSSGGFSGGSSFGGSRSGGGGFSGGGGRSGGSRR